MHFHKKIAIIIFVAARLYGSAQTFNYSFSQSTASYIALPHDSGVSVIDEIHSGEQYRFPVGFSFSFLGSTFDTVSVSPSGIISFNGEDAYSISSFGNLFTLVDSARHSVIKYTAIGSAGNKIGKIEFSDFSFGMSAPGEYICLQVWLYEQDNKIEIHTGPVNVDIEPNPLKPFTGLVNEQRNTSPWAYVLSGEAAAPTVGNLSGATEKIYMNNLPAEGTVYIFTLIE